MKTLFALTLALGLSSQVMASSLNETALKTLLTTPGIQVAGDVHSDETLESIYQGAVEAGARIENECSPINSRYAKCTLWLTFKPIGETALQYTVELPGTKLASSIIEVARGD